MTQNILTIDDEEVILSLLRELFEEEGYSIAQASTQREAKAAIAAKTPDLIITDLHLANSDGLAPKSPLITTRRHLWKLYSKQSENYYRPTSRRPPPLKINKPLPLR